MLEIRRGIAARSYENSFFREFAQNVSAMFEKYNWDGLLIGNSECIVDDRLQIDALLITKNVVLIIDFKNFGGDIALPHSTDFEFGKWTNIDGEMVKGGNSINPFCQLKKQRTRLYEVFKSSIEIALPDGDLFNPAHAIRIVCFQKEINLIGTIPAKDEINFKIIHKGDYLERLKDLIDVEDKQVNLTPAGYRAFNDVFQADPFDVREVYKQAFDYDTTKTYLDVDHLRKDQLRALSEIEAFIANEDENAFILQGTSNSGKTHLIPFIKDRALELGIAQVEVLAPSSRIANNLVRNIEDIGSLYSYIYGGNTVVDEESENIDSPEEEETKTKLEIVPLKQSDDEENTLYIIDESQLISDSYNQSIDLRFGSGHLLKDFLKYLKFGESKRKVVFVGDCYQISAGHQDESSLSPSYLTDHYNLKVRAFHLDDHTDGNLILENALQCVRGIRKNLFNHLSFEFDKYFVELPRDKEAVRSSLNEYLKQPHSFKFLTYSREDAQKINQRIKNTILNNGEDIVPGDLLLLNNNIRVEVADDPFTRPQKLYNGQFLELVSADDTYIEEITNKKGELTKLYFRKLKVKVLGKDASVNLLSLENFRASTKGELSNDEIVGIKILLDRELSDNLKKNPFESSQNYQALIRSSAYKELERETEELERKHKQGERVKTKLDEAQRRLRGMKKKSRSKFREEIKRTLLNDPSTKYYRIRNLAYIRFGWALNVHKAMSYKWDKVIFNVDWNKGITNSAYFRLLYTGITRAKNEIKLINYQAIHPLLNTELRNVGTIGKAKHDFYLVTEKDYQINQSDEALLNQFRLSESPNKEMIVQLYQVVLSKLHSSELEIRSIEHPDYQQVYAIKQGAKEAKIRFYYDMKLNVKRPGIQSGEDRDFNQKVLDLLLSDRAIENFSFITDDWRSEFYEQLNHCLVQNDFSIISITQRPYKDYVVLVQGDNTLETELNYNGDGFFSSINSRVASSGSLWEQFFESIKSMKHGKQ